MFLRSLRLSFVTLLCVGVFACTQTSGGEGEADSMAPEAGADGVAAPDFPEEGPAATIEAPAGTRLTVELTAQLSTETSSSGDEFQAVLSEDVVVDGRTLIPAGAGVVGRVAAAQRAGRVQGVSRIDLVLTRVGGHDVDTLPFVAQADTERGEDAIRIGTGAGIGAAIGAVLGGGEGAAIGAAIGGGAGTAVVLSDRGDDIVIRPDAPIGFELEEPLMVAE